MLLVAHSMPDLTLGVLFSSSYLPFNPLSSMTKSDQTQAHALVSNMAPTDLGSDSSTLAHMPWHRITVDT